MASPSSSTVAEPTTRSKTNEDFDIANIRPEIEAFWGDVSNATSASRALGITWRDLTVEAVSADAAINESFTSQFNVLNGMRDSKQKPSPRTILDHSHGCVKPGEMLLVLGRPGSGCTTLLSILANKRRGYTSVTGDVSYGSMTASEAEAYRGQIVMNTEEDLFFPALTVDQTMDFATRLKLPARLPSGTTSKNAYQKDFRDFLLQSMSIFHTKDTKVGNEYVRGCSGGERKRVSITECMATRGSVYCWDNSTRGLDASSALDYTRVIRALTDTLGLSSIVSLYQAGNGIYDLFDKVLVLDEGKQIFYGPLHEAKPFMEDLGLICEDGSNVADFLTGVTVPTERKIRPGYHNTTPRNADAFRQEYEKSQIYQRMVSEYVYPETEIAQLQTDSFKVVIAAERDHQLPASSTSTVGFPAQVLACVVRQYQIVWGDRQGLFIRHIINVVMAFVSGSLFYKSPADSSGLFTKGGAIFFTLLHHSMMGLSEVTDSFTGRPVILKHKSFALFHPAAFCIAQIAVDISVVLFQVTIFALIAYWLVGLTATAGAFFTHWIVMCAITLCMMAFFRAIGASFPNFDAASKVSGTLVNSYVIYIGYMIPKPEMHPWFVWVYWINPLSYAFDALMSNEFHGKHVECVGTNLIPSGPSYNNTSSQACAGVSGAVQGMTTLTGDQYLASLSYSYDNVWRNFGIILAWWAFSVLLTIFSTSRWRSVSERGPSLLIPREKSKAAKPLQPDLEMQSSDEKFQKTPGQVQSSAKLVEGEKSPGGLIRNTSVFTWKNLYYTVKTPSGDRTILDNAQGWVKPGMLGALMGSSGAGKTTLLDVLAQRKTEGTIRGSILVDGRPLPISFQRSAGYCEQLDIHEPFATVREALEFSALLRQSRDTPKEEKLSYVDTIIDLLELHDLADTIIGRVGAGLSVEQRKRVTIGIELVAKPRILIFLDEPTSGLDGQSAHNTVRFLRKLAAAGQAVLVTIHQPSAQLFYQFDTLLLLASGGKTVYFGDVGENAKMVRDYFGRHGAPCPPGMNPAEHMIDVVSGHHSRGRDSRDWSQTWLESPEHNAVTRELDRLVSDAAAKPPRTNDDGHEFAMPLWEQCRIVTRRMNISLFRNTDYINNKIMLHITSALFNGFTFWKIGNTVGDLQLAMFTIFNFIFVAPGVMAQLQPLFIERRDLFEAREKKSKSYSWIAFVTGIVVSEIPYLCICAILYFACWYYTVGFPTDSNRAGATLFVMIMYEFVYTGIGQFVAVYAPNAVFAALTNPFFLGDLVMFCGVMVPYSQIQPFWRYWIYYLDPFNYLMGSLLVFDLWGTEVTCADDEFAIFNPPDGLNCGDYLADYKAGAGVGSNLINPDATEACRVCQYSDGGDYLRGMNLLEYEYGWRDAGIVVLFVFSSYALVYMLMKLRTKTTKKPE